MSDKISIIEDTPFGGPVVPKHESGDTNLIAAETTRALQEAQAGFVMAKQFPRNEGTAVERIMRSCQRRTLAEQAIYAFPRGGKQVTGPSIRLAEVLAQHWGNINFGYRELHEGPGMTQVLAYAYDLETNTRAEKVFHVKHVRDTKKGTFEITDRRDLYELIANQASRRIRSCILQIIPGDVVEAAIEAANSALEKHEGDNIEERRAKVVDAFKEFDVTQDMIEARMGKKITGLLPADLVVLRQIHSSLRDGIGNVAQWFPPDAVEKAKEKVAEAKKATKKKAPPKAKGKAEKAPEPPPEPEPTEPVEEPPEDPEPPADPQEEANEPDLEDVPPWDGMTQEEIEASITVTTSRGRPSNFQIQVEKHTINALQLLIESGLTEDEATEITARSIYEILVKEFDFENINEMPITHRPAFIDSLSKWSGNPTGANDE